MLLSLLCGLVLISVCRAWWLPGRVTKPMLAVPSKGQILTPPPTVIKSDLMRTLKDWDALLIEELTTGKAFVLNRQLKDALANDVGLAKLELVGKAVAYRYGKYSGLIHAEILKRIVADKGDMRYSRGCILLHRFFPDSEEALVSTRMCYITLLENKRYYTILKLVKDMITTNPNGKEVIWLVKQCERLPQFSRCKDKIGSELSSRLPNNHPYKGTHGSLLPNCDRESELEREIQAKKLSEESLRSFISSRDRLTRAQCVLIFYYVTGSNAPVLLSDSSESDIEYTKGHLRNEK